MHADGRKNGLNSTLIAAKIPDEVAERLRVEANEKNLSLGLWLKEHLIEWSGVGVEAVDVRTAKSI
jgi:hypothetical protein